MILVLVETSPSGEAVEVSREAVTFARSLSASGGGVPVDAVVVGEASEALVAIHLAMSAGGGYASGAAA